MGLTRGSNEPHIRWGFRSPMRTGTFEVEVDRISVSVSAPKLVKSLVLACFRFRYVKPRQVSVSAETVSEFRCWPKLGSCCLHQFFRVRAELYVIAVPPPSARIYPMQCDGTAGRAWRAPHSSSHLQLHCCSSPRRHRALSPRQRRQRPSPWRPVFGRRMIIYIIVVWLGNYRKPSRLLAGSGKLPPRNTSAAIDGYLRVLAQQSVP